MISSRLLIFIAFLLIGILCLSTSTTAIELTHQILNSDGNVDHKQNGQLVITRSLAGDHWYEPMQTRCLLYRNAVYSADQETCRCPLHYPNFHSRNGGEETGCFSIDEIDASKFNVFHLFLAFKILLRIFCDFLFS